MSHDFHEVPELPQFHAADHTGKLYTDTGSIMAAAAPGAPGYIPMTADSNVQSTPGAAMPHPDDNPTQSFRAEIESITPVAAGVVELVLAGPRDIPLPEWEPGAHLDIHLPNGLVRHYSLVPNGGDRSRYRVAVLREPSGRGGSEYIHSALRPGTALRCAGPRNNFALRSAPGYLFIAGGIGITPLLAMIEQAETEGTPWRLAYFGRTAESMAWAEELRQRHPARVEVRSDDRNGRPDMGQVLAGLAEGELVYACGPDGMLDAVTRALGDRAAAALHVERFSPADPEALIRDREPFDVRLDRSGVDLHIPADKTILEVMEERGLPVISSCREGTCGTCETPILAGEADHRDSILSDEEKRDNETMMICCSRGRRGSALVIDA
ncbi:PDR/VanB family oxidoreductase [Nocardia sp. NPDC050697]|uniref:PDR/VanB family oxidoreductase n=1 Tax=Nocardia sp. NPDC050697 TaxID=3155158 RepID=UPI0033CF6478